MRRLPSFLFAVLPLGVTFAALGVACSFPDVSIDDRLGDSSFDSAGSDTDLGGDAAKDTSSGDGGDGGDVGDVSHADVGDTNVEGGGEVGPDGGDGSDAKLDVGDTRDAGDTTPTCTKACDCDDDTDKANAGTCGGLDCDDYDPRASSKITAFNATDLATLTTKGDWNCNKTLEKQYPINVSCSKLALGGCDGQQGFSGDPACATSGVYVFCKTNLAVACVEDHNETRTQGCK